MAAKRLPKGQAYGRVGNYGAAIDTTGMSEAEKTTFGIKKPRTGEMPVGSKMGGKRFVPKPVKQPRKSR